MRNHSNDDLVLMLEESLFILEECLQRDNSLLQDPIIVSHHIQTLKRFYSPDFDLDYSESGSYFYAALLSIDNCYVDPGAIYHTPLSSRFINSLQRLLHMSRLSLNFRMHRCEIIEQLQSLSSLWKLHSTMDMQSLVLQVLTLMRSELADHNKTKMDSLYG